MMRFLILLLIVSSADAAQMWTFRYRNSDKYVMADCTENNTPCVGPASGTQSVTVIDVSNGMPTRNATTTSLYGGGGLKIDTVNASVTAWLDSDTAASAAFTQASSLKPVFPAPVTINTSLTANQLVYGLGPTQNASNSNAFTVDPVNLQIIATGNGHTATVDGGVLGVGPGPRFVLDDNTAHTEYRENQLLLGASASYAFTFTSGDPSWKWQFPFGALSNARMDLSIESTETQGPIEFGWGGNGFFTISNPYTMSRLVSGNYAISKYNFATLPLTADKGVVVGNLGLTNGVTLTAQAGDTLNVSSTTAAGITINQLPVGGPSIPSAFAGTVTLGLASTTITINLPVTLPNTNYAVTLTSADTTTGLPTGIRVSTRNTSNFILTYTAPGANTVIVWTVQKY